MNKFFTYISLALSLAACTGEEGIITPEPDIKGDGDLVVTDKITGDLMNLDTPILITNNSHSSRAALKYDDATKKMMFKWSDDDCIGVFTYSESEPAKSSQMKFPQIKSGDDTDQHRTFMTNDGALKVETGNQYVACLPYFKDHPLNYTNIPVSYTGQRQTEPVDFSNYWNDQNDKGYQDSQEKASAHLSAYDYLCTGPTETTENGGIHFSLNRMAAIVRFWIQISPDNNYVYDELQLTNPSKAFTTAATMDAAAITLTPTATSHTLSLMLGNDSEGFDMTEKTNDGTKSTTPFYDWYAGTYTGYIMAYMMVAPIDLTTADPCQIYLLAHEKNNPTEKHYFMSGPLSKPSLQPNTFYQWTVASLSEYSPIQFSEITVEEWRKGTEFTNDGGSGTGSW